MNLPGLRNFKTALSVVICAVTITILNNHTPNFEFTYFYAAISAIFALSTTLDASYVRGKERILGTIIGGVIATIMGLVRIKILAGSFQMVFLFFEIMLTIHVINSFKLKVGVMVGCVMVIASFTTRTDHFVLYSIFRTLETIYGVIVAYLVNKYVFPYTQET